MFFSCLSDGLTFLNKPYESRPICNLRWSTAEWRINTNPISHRRSLNGRQSWAILCRYRCHLLLAEIPKGLRQERRTEAAPIIVGSWRVVRTQLDSKELGQRHTSHRVGASAGQYVQHGEVRRCTKSHLERTGPQQDRSSDACPRQTGADERTTTHLPMSWVGPTAGQGRRMFRGLDVLTVILATNDLPEEYRFLVDAQLMFLTKEKTAQQRCSTMSGSDL